MAVTLPTDDPITYAKALVTEFESLADANAGDFTAACTWAEQELSDAEATMTADEFRAFKLQAAMHLDNFYQNYSYTP